VLEQVAFPAVALRIAELAASPDADVLRMAGLVSRDPSLSAAVIAVANSAVFQGVSPVQTVREAVARLGLSEVSRTAAAVAARGLFEASAGTPAAGARAREAFRHAVAVAGGAAAAALRQRGARSDHTYLGGLLHDVGKPLALRLLAADVAATGDLHPTGPRLARVLEEVHVEVGAAAHAAWGLPAYLAAICARHHDAEVEAAPEHVDLHLVRLTSALADLRDPAFAARAAREIVQSAGALGLDPYAVRALAADLAQAEARAAALVG
jgi:putative nucleotidyltransferase with HDIG domain